MFEVNGKKVLVTGSTQGIGLAIVTMFSEAGAQVWVAGTRQGKTDEVAKLLGGPARAVWGDLANPETPKHMHDVTGDVDILVLNASVQYRRHWDEISLEEFDTQMHVNLFANLRLIQLYAPAMLSKGWGRIITIGSVQEFVPHRDMAVYAASKSGLDNLVKNLAKQFGPYHVTVNNVLPGAMLTPRNAGAVSDKGYMQKVLAGIPLGSMGKASDCNGVVRLLASEDGAYITGATISVDGGMSL